MVALAPTWGVLEASCFIGIEASDKFETLLFLEWLRRCPLVWVLLLLEPILGEEFEEA